MTVGLSRNARVAVALAGELWAYFSSVRRGELVSSPGILTVFQQHYNDYRGSLVDYYRDPGGASEAAIAQIPMALGVDGRWGRHSRQAAIAVLQAARPTWASQLGSMPTTQGAIGTWWWTHLAGTVESTNPGWDAVAATSNRGVDAGPALSSWAFSYIEGLGADTSAPATGSRFDFSSLIGGATASRFASMALATRAAAAGSGADLPGAGTPQSPAGGETFLVGGRPPPPPGPDWALWVGLAAVVGLGGMLAFNVWRKQR